MNINSIFGAKKTLILLNRQSLEFYFADNSPNLSFLLPSDSFRAEEIIDREKFLTQIEQFLLSNHLRGLSAGLILNDELLYHQVISESSQIDQFIEKLPFVKEKIVTKVYLIENKQLLLATNGDLFLAASDAIIKTGGEVSFIVPFSLLNTANINSQQVEKIFSDKPLLQKISFV